MALLILVVCHLARVVRPSRSPDLSRRHPKASNGRLSEIRIQPGGVVRLDVGNFNIKESKKVYRF